jgi:hypothetical protein
LLKIATFVFFLTGSFFSLSAQDNQAQTQLKLQQAIQKKSEYHRLTNGVQDGYRIKIHFGIDREAAENVRTKFSKTFSEYDTYKEYQQPNFVVLVGDFKTKLEAFESLRKIKPEFPTAFIVKEKINVK